MIFSNIILSEGIKGSCNKRFFSVRTNKGCLLFGFRTHPVFVNTYVLQFKIMDETTWITCSASRAYIHPQFRNSAYLQNLIVFCLFLDQTVSRIFKQGDHMMLKVILSVYSCSIKNFFKKCLWREKHILNCFCSSEEKSILYW